MTRCSWHAGINVRPRATKTVLDLQLLRSLQSSDSFGGTRADIKPSVPRATGHYNIITKEFRFLPLPLMTDLSLTSSEPQMNLIT